MLYVNPNYSRAHISTVIFHPGAGSRHHPGPLVLQGGGGGPHHIKPAQDCGPKGATQEGAINIPGQDGGKGRMQGGGEVGGRKMMRWGDSSPSRGME